MPVRVLCSGGNDSPGHHSDIDGSTNELVYLHSSEGYELVYQFNDNYAADLVTTAADATHGCMQSTDGTSGQTAFITDNTDGR